MRFLIFSVLFTAAIIAQDLPPINIQYASQALDASGRVLGYFGEKYRVDVKSTGYISKYVLRSLIATEDRDFYNHNGVSYKGLLRGIFKTLSGSKQGGSTLTMQLARNLFLTNEQTISRKLTEMDLAQKIEQRFTKDQILLMYLNTVYFGRSVYGIYAAAQEYYGKTPDKLSITESAALVGLLKNPSGYDPGKAPDKMLKRRNEVLHNLVETGSLSEAEFNKLKNTPLNLKLSPQNGKHFLEQIRREALEIIGKLGLTLQTSELTITTTLDPVVQKAAEDALAAQWSLFPQKLQDAQAALVCVENSTGYIRAMLGGNPKSDPKGLNRAVQSKRQPGSSFKPFVYGAMLKQGYTLATPMPDLPIIIDSGKTNEWRPQNSDENFTGKMMSMQEALQHSVNVCAAYSISHYVTPDSVVAFAKQLGIQSVIPPYPSIALGSAEVSPLELAGAYSVIPSMGRYRKPISILKIEDKWGKVIYQAQNPETVVADSSLCYLLNELMKPVVDSGTASSIRKFYKGFAAGKTGTSQNNTDAWFAGYTSNYTTVIWSGFDNQQKKLSGEFKYGGTVCAPIFGRMMAALTAARKNNASYTMPRPEEIVTVPLCKETGEIANEFCPVKAEYPINALVSVKVCSLHTGEPKAEER